MTGAELAFRGGGLGALPAPPTISALTAQQRNQIKANAEAVFRAELQAAIPAGPLLNLPQAEELKRDILAGMGVPDIPLELPSSITVEALGDAVFAAGREWAEQTLQQYTGFPIPIPSKLTPEAIGREIAALIPTDLEAVLDAALMIGGQAVSSALTGLLAGASIGSAIPGFGTVVGIGVALGIGALREAFAEEPPPYTRVCGGRWGCEPVPYNITPLEMVVWSHNAYANTSRTYSSLQAYEYCQGGEIGSCLRYWRRLREVSIAASMTTPLVLTGPEVDKYLALFNSGQQSFAEFSPGQKQVVQRQWHWEFYRIIELLNQRRSYLNFLGGALAQLPALNATQVRQLQLTLLDEMRNAAVQLQNSQGTNMYGPNVQWLALTYAGLQAASARLLELSPASTASWDEKVEGFLRAERQAPDRPPAPAGPSREEQCFAATTAWFATNPELATCLQVPDAAILFDLCRGVRVKPGSFGWSMQEAQSAWHNYVFKRCRAPKQVLVAAAAPKLPAPLVVVGGAGAGAALALLAFKLITRAP